jgi:hypothetical protein
LRIIGTLKVFGPTAVQLLGYVLLLLPQALLIFVGLFAMAAQHEASPPDWFGFIFDAACTPLGLLTALLVWISKRRSGLRRMQRIRDAGQWAAPAALAAVFVIAIEAAIAAL